MSILHNLIGTQTEAACHGHHVQSCFNLLGTIVRIRCIQEVEQVQIFRQTLDKHHDKGWGMFACLFNIPCLVWDIASAERPVFCHCCPADAPCGASHVLHSVLCPPDIHLEHRHSQISLASILRNSKLSASASSAVSITHHTIQTPSSASILRNSKLQQVLQLSITHHTTQTPSRA